MLGTILVVLLIVILVIVVGLIWICVTLINNRLDTPSLERFANGYLDQMGESYCRGFNQQLVARDIPPTGPVMHAITEPAAEWSELDKTTQHQPESEVEVIG